MRKDKKKAGLRVFWTMVIEFDLIIIAAILWVRIGGNSGLIAAFCVFAVMVWFPFVTLNSRSRLNIWIDGVMHKLNMASMRLYTKIMERPPIRTSKHDDPEKFTTYAKNYISKIQSSKRTLIRYPTQGISGGTLVVLFITAGVMQYFLFWILYYNLELTTLACWISIIGTFLIEAALMIQYFLKGTEKGPKFFILLVGSTGYIIWSLIFYVYMMRSA